MGKLGEEFYFFKKINNELVYELLECCYVTGNRQERFTLDLREYV